MTDYPDSWSAEGIEFAKNVAVDVERNKAEHQCKLEFNNFVRRLKSRLKTNLSDPNYQRALKCIKDSIL